MPFSNLFGTGALGALRGLVISFQGRAKETSKGTRVSGVDVRRGLGGRYRPRKTGPNFVVLVFIKYAGWVRGSPGSPEEANMQLNSVFNDLTEVLKYLRYRHDDTKTMWCLLIDFEFKYTDETGRTEILRGTNPTEGAILSALEEAGRTGRSGLVYFGGHGEYKPRGTSVLDTHEGQTRYTVTVDPNSDPKVKSSFLLAIDGGRIYGEDIISRLPEEASGECIHTVAIDACHGGGVASVARNLLHIYDGKKPQSGRPAEERVEIGIAEQRSSKQLVIISAAKEGELARTVCPYPNSKREFGKLTWYMLHWLSVHPHVNAQNLSERLEQTCVKMAKVGEEQHPEISARHALEGPFEILPGLLDEDGDGVEYPERTFPTLHWFRPPRLSSGSWTIYRVPHRRVAAY